MKRLVTICALFCLSAPAFAESCREALKSVENGHATIDTVIAADICEQENDKICTNAEELEMIDGLPNGESKTIAQACRLTGATGGQRVAVAGFSDGVVGTNGLLNGCFHATDDGDAAGAMSLFGAVQTCEKETEKFCEMISKEEGEGNDAAFIAARCRLEAARGANIALQLWLP